MTHLQATRACILVIFITLIFMLKGHGQSVGDIVSYSVVPSCESPDPNKPTNIGQYYLQLSIDSLFSTNGDFDIMVDGSSVFQFFIDQSDLPYTKFIGPFNHSGVGGSYHEYIIRSLESGQGDTLYLPELICGRSTSNGLNSAGYFCERGDLGIVAQVSPEALNSPQLPEKTYVYVLVQSATHLVIDRNFSGEFTSLSDLTEYEVHAFAISFDRQAEFINGLRIGEVLDQSDLDICYALCGIYSLVVDCSSFDLSLIKSVRGGFVYSIGDIVTFDIEVFNDGRVTAYNVVVVDSLPDALTFLPDRNPQWNADLSSLPVDSILAGSSVVIPMVVQVNGSSSSIDVVNEAEIIFASNDPDNDTPAYDVDSTPDNDDFEEDDQDDVEITILENLCSATFDIRADHELVCEGGDITMMAMINMATRPIEYRWRKDGILVSRDSIYVIENPGEADYGEYALTIIDGNGCSSTEYIKLAPIINDERFACFNQINVGVNSNCQISLRPSMFTSREVSAIDDYLIEVRDDQGILVDLMDLSIYPPGSILEARIINPCTMETICWSNIHLEHKAFPLHDIYSQDVFVTSCLLVSSDNPTEIIEKYNSSFEDDIILDEEAYATKFNRETCLQEWNVRVTDNFIEGAGDCGSRSALRIYNVFNQEIDVAIDSAILVIEPIMVESFSLPEDVDNISCGTNLSPKDLESFPSFLLNGETHYFDDEYSNQSSTFCNIGITYSDEYIDQSCQFGTYKVIRKWSTTDWCSNVHHEGIQYLFVVDQEAPAVTISQSTINIKTAPFECFAIVSIFDYLEIEDFCDVTPKVEVSGFVDPKMMQLALGDHDIQVIISDKCGNQETEDLHFNISEDSPPVPILKENLTISLSPNLGIFNNYIDALFLDAGSHDSDCGPVELQIARASEVLLVESSSNGFSVEGDLKNCLLELENLDSDKNGLLEIDELFRDQITFCCQDIGSHVDIVVRVYDGSGNVATSQVGVFVDAKLEWTACDDGDPCTINDRNYGDCPCEGIPNIEDIDKDKIVDCMDELITVCFNNEQHDIPYDEVQDWLSKGAEGGPCMANEEMASVAGEVFTTSGDMIEKVLITVNDEKEYMTISDGYYRFDNNEMYQYYELYPERDDDPVNGITTLDMVMLQEYILQKRVIDDPYLLIAADVNNDGRISALDIAELRKLILGKTDKIYNNKSWRFVVEDYKFEDITNPSNYQEVNVISSLTEDMMDENWIGVKIGDISNSAIPNKLKSFSRSDKTYVLELPDIIFQKGEVISFPISVSEDLEMRGLQFSLNFKNLEFLSLSSNDVSISSNQYVVEGKKDEILKVVWESPELISVEKNLFTLSFKTKEAGRLSELVNLNNWDIIPLIASQEYEDVPLDVDFVQRDLASELYSVKLYQNQPNPFNGETIIQFYIPKEDQVSISFFDQSGKMLHQITDFYTKGVNAIRLTHDDLAHFKGVVFYQLRYQDKVFSRKMVVSD